MKNQKGLGEERGERVKGYLLGVQSILLYGFQGSNLDQVRLDDKDLYLLAVLPTHVLVCLSGSQVAQSGCNFCVAKDNLEQLLLLLL